MPKYLLIRGISIPLFPVTDYSLLRCDRVVVHYSNKNIRHTELQSFYADTVIRRTAFLSTQPFIATQDFVLLPHYLHLIRIKRSKNILGTVTLE